jgi:hypothetical protein
LEDKKTKRSDKRWKTPTQNGKRFTKLERKSLFLKITIDKHIDIYGLQNERFCKRLIAKFAKFHFFEIRHCRLEPPNLSGG